MTLTEFLLARIAEDEAVDVHADTCESHDRNGGFPCDCWLAQRWRADCKRDRRIVEEHNEREVASLDRETWGQPFLVCRRCCEGGRQVVAPCPTLRALALPYADHPDYREEWAL